MRGLNKELGEFVPQLGKLYRIAENQKWAGSPFFADACAHAAQVFKAAGYNRKVQFFEDNVLVQEYPLTSKLVFFFVLDIKGKPHFTHYEWTFDIEAIGQLVASNMWDTSVPLGTVH